MDDPFEREDWAIGNKELTEGMVRGTPFWEGSSAMQVRTS